MGRTEAVFSMLFSSSRALLFAAGRLTDDANSNACPFFVSIGALRTQ